MGSAFDQVEMSCGSSMEFLVSNMLVLIHCGNLSSNTPFLDLSYLLENRPLSVPKVVGLAQEQHAVANRELVGVYVC